MHALKNCVCVLTISQALLASSSESGQLGCAGSVANVMSATRRFARQIGRKTLSISTRECVCVILSEFVGMQTCHLVDSLVH